MSIGQFLFHMYINIARMLKSWYELSSHNFPLVWGSAIFEREKEHQLWATALSLRCNALLSFTMQPLDPITLAIIAVVVAVILSALLLLLFTSREEKFEDVLAAQRSEQEAYLVRSAGVKSAKARKKFSKGKKKYSDDGEVMEEVSEPLVEETIETSHVEEDDSGFSPSGKYFMEADPPDEEKVTLAEEKPSTGIMKERPGKKKSKKAVPRVEKSSVSGQHVSFDKPREDVEEVVTQLDSASTLENEPGKFEELEIEEQKLPESNETAASAKKSKSNPKPAKDKGSIQGQCGVDCNK